ncbi:hypothetical protein SSKA14_2236 [Stenotrophomonas sp. SKA14]|nr:hypothetical protein SSKA14_2236 [Stenotrophomonas sp. SKA14]
MVGANLGWHGWLHPRMAWIYRCGGCQPWLARMVASTHGVDLLAGFEPSTHGMDLQ